MIIIITFSNYFTTELAENMKECLTVIQYIHAADDRLLIDVVEGFVCKDNIPQTCYLEKNKFILKLFYCINVEII